MRKKPSFFVINVTTLLSCRENDNELAPILQEVGYTDFPISNKLYQGDGVVMLKSEH